MVAANGAANSADRANSDNLGGTAESALHSNKALSPVLTVLAVPTTTA